MTDPGPLRRRGAGAPTLPRGEVLGTYETYPEAQRVVDRLSHAEFPVEKVAIVGNDLKTVERVTGRRTYGRAALAGALTGLWLGVFVGVVLVLLAPEEVTLSSLGAAALIGAGFGMLYGVVNAALTRRRRDFTSTHQVLASDYQVVVDPALVHRAREVLARPEPGRR